MKTMTMKKSAALAAAAALVLTGVSAQGAMAATQSQSAGSDSDVLQAAYDEGSMQGALEAAYDLGYESNWSGTVEFDEPIINEAGDAILGIIDVDKALTADEALDAGFISEDDENLSEAEEPGMSIQARVTCGSSSAVYKWTRAGSDVTCFSNGAGYPSGSTATINALCIRGSGGAGYQGRTLYRTAGVTVTNWSQWRSSAATSYSCYGFGSNVAGIQASVQRFR